MVEDKKPVEPKKPVIPAACPNCGCDPKTGPRDSEDDTRCTHCGFLFA